MRRSASLTLVALAALLAPAGPTEAGLIITIEDQTVHAGQAADVKVNVRSDSGTTVNLDSFGYQFLITPDAGVAPILQFATPSSTGFASGDVSISPAGYLGDTFIGFVQDYQTVVDDQPDKWSLGTLSVKVAGPLAPDFLGTFTISLLPPGGNSDPGDSSAFFDPDFASIPFISFSGTITVTGNPPLQAVPEPATLASALSGALVLLVAGWRSRRARAASMRTQPLDS